MKFLNYINGQRSGKEAHLIEKEAMEDLFLQEAMEGYESINGNHLADIAQIRANIKKKSQAPRKKKPIWLSIAASVAILVALATYIAIDKNNQYIYAQFEFANNNNTAINLYYQHR